MHTTIEYNQLERDYMDLQFDFPCYDCGGEAGIVSDGSFIYTSMWNNDYFIKYSFGGTFIDTIYIDGADGWVRNMVYCEADGYIYGTHISQNTNDYNIFVMDFITGIVVDTIELPSKGRALGYNTDLDVFYTNNWDSDVMVIDRVTGNLLDTIPLPGVYSSYYGFAYDNWSDGGPYLWGFSQDGYGTVLVQLNLPDLTETGFVMDLSTLSTTGSGIAGGLFIQEGIIADKVTLGGLIQNEVIFGLELSDVVPPPPTAILAGYNIYRDATQLNTNLIVDTIYNDNNLDPGTYLYEVTSVYYDNDGIFYCESAPAGPETVLIENQMLMLGGNVFVGSMKLDDGKAHAYSNNSDEIVHELSVDIDDLGYYFFFPFQTSDYYVVASPTINSEYYEDYISTYYGNVYHWENSPTIHLQTNMYNEDINLIKLAYSSLGSGSISGVINFEDKSMITTPASDILMLLLNNENNCVAYVYSNTDGEFNFNQLDFGTYSLLCEIIGKKMAPKLFTINNTNPNYDGISFLVKEDEIVLGIDEDLPESVSFLSEVFPNPVLVSANIEIALTKGEIVTIKLYDITGKVIESRVQQLGMGLNRIEINTSEIAPGIKFLNIEFSDKASINKKFIAY
ncbi:MAG: T9SS type A sorting domain-containing protein [Bacteroidetes bacterium]|nr:T9SS type A sorting domain-containing protein [Bacteroidota bacterium]